MAPSKDMRSAGHPPSGRGASEGGVGPGPTTQPAEVSGSRMAARAQTDRAEQRGGGEGAARRRPASEGGYEEGSGGYRPAQPITARGEEGRDPSPPASPHMPADGRAMPVVINVCSSARRDYPRAAQYGNNWEAAPVGYPIPLRTDQSSDLYAEADTSPVVELIITTTADTLAAAVIPRLLDLSPEVTVLHAWSQGYRPSAPETDFEKQPQGRAHTISCYVAVVADTQGLPAAHRHRGGPITLYQPLLRGGEWVTLPGPRPHPRAEERVLLVFVDPFYTVQAYLDRLNTGAWGDFDPARVLCMPEGATVACPMGTVEPEQRRALEAMQGSISRHYAAACKKGAFPPAKVLERFPYGLQAFHPGAMPRLAHNWPLAQRHYNDLQIDSTQQGWLFDPLPLVKQEAPYNLRLTSSPDSAQEIEAFHAVRARVQQMVDQAIQLRDSAVRMGRFPTRPDMVHWGLGDRALSLFADPPALQEDPRTLPPGSAVRDLPLTFDKVRSVMLFARRIGAVALAFADPQPDATAGAAVKAAVEWGSTQVNAIQFHVRLRSGWVPADAINCGTLLKHTGNCGIKEGLALLSIGKPAEEGSPVTAWGRLSELFELYTGMPPEAAAPQAAAVPPHAEEVLAAPPADGQAGLRRGSRLVGAPGGGPVSPQHSPLLPPQRSQHREGSVERRPDTARPPPRPESGAVAGQPWLPPPPPLPPSGQPPREPDNARQGRAPPHPDEEEDWRFSEDLLPASDTHQSRPGRHQVAVDHPPTGLPRPPQRGPDSRKCFGCGKEGHVVRNCPRGPHELPAPLQSTAARGVPAGRSPARQGRPGSGQGDPGTKRARSPSPFRASQGHTDAQLQRSTAIPRPAAPTNMPRIGGTGGIAPTKPTAAGTQDGKARGVTGRGGGTRDRRRSPSAEGGRARSCDAGDRGRTYSREPAERRRHQSSDDDERGHHYRGDDQEQGGRKRGRDGGHTQPRKVSAWGNSAWTPWPRPRWMAWIVLFMLALFAFSMPLVRGAGGQHLTPLQLSTQLQRAHARVDAWDTGGRDGATGAFHPDMPWDCWDDLGDAELYEESVGPDSAHAHSAAFGGPPGAFIDSITPHGPDEPPIKPDGAYQTEHEWTIGAHSAITPQQRAQLEDTVLLKKQAFAYSMEELPGYTGPEGVFRIDITDPEKPCFQKQRPFAPLEEKIMDEKMAPLIAAGVCVPCPAGCTLFASNSVLAAKKNEEGLWVDRRLCHDLRNINARTPADKFYMEQPEQMHSAMEGCKYFSKLDARSGYLQIPILPEHQPRTAFWYRGKLWMYTRSPFGLRNSGIHFNKVMQTAITQADLDGCCKAFVDDICIFSRTFEEHLVHISAVLDMLIANGLRAHPAKSTFGAEVVEFIGHMMGANGMTPCPSKVAAIRQLQSPRSLKELQRVLGLMNYYRGYVPRYSILARPLTELTQLGVVWPSCWGEEQEAAFHELKESLCQPGNALKRADPSRPYLLLTDFSNRGIAGILGQKDDEGNEYIVACISRSLNRHEQQYVSYKGEMLAAVWAVRALRHHLLGVHFTLVTDHAPLVFLMQNPNLTGVYARWALILSEYDFQVVHRPGINHQAPDCLSRDPLPDSSDNTGARIDVDVSDASATPGLTALAMLSSYIARHAGANCNMGPDEGVVCMAAHASPDELPQQVALAAATAASAAWADDWLDQYCHYEDESSFHTPATDTFEPFSSAQWERLVALRYSAARWVDDTWEDLQAMLGAEPGRLTFTAAPPDAFHVRGVRAIDSTPVPGRTIQAMLSGSVTLFEPFGGLAAGLEMLLRNGVVISRYIYCDISAAARAIAAHRLGLLSAAYPGQLPPDAWADAFRTVPQDIYAITTAELIHAGALDGTQWVVVAGFECQDLSPAGSGKGLQGAKSSSFYPLVQLLGTLQQLQWACPPVYLIENTAMQFGARARPELLRDYDTICDAIGPSVLLDAARVNSHAHRLRNYWSNLAPATHLQITLDGIYRFVGLRVDDILAPGRQAQRCVSVAPPPYYPANMVGRPLSALPTLVAYPASHAFRDGQPGMVLDIASGLLVPLLIEERERALGYEAGCTAALTVTMAERHAATGSCMDANALQHLFAVAVALGVRTSGAVSGVVAMVASALPIEHAPPSVQPALLFKHNLIVAAMAQGQDVSLAPQRADADVWGDSVCMAYIRDGQLPVGSELPTATKARVLRRARSYVMQGGRLHRRMHDLSLKEVPPPAERAAVVRAIHEKCGHFGRRRTVHLLMLHYWWPGLYEDVDSCIRACLPCSQINRVAFNSLQPVLQPLPIMGMFYRWHVDLCGPFPATARGHKYIMVMVEAYSKHAELVPITSKLPGVTKYAFEHNVLGRFGACAEITTDQGGEWEGAFSEMCSDNFIDRRIASPSHAQANGLAERCVQTLKRCLKKHVEATGNVTNWDELVPWIALGYRASPQAASKLAPYQMLYAVAPTIPPNIRERFVEPIDFDDHEAASDALLRRAADVKRMCITAGDNLLIAQHRDTLRYAKLRSGGYLPKVLRFETGDFVYTKRLKREYTTLQARARPEVLRVKEVRPSGVLILQGRCGKTIAENATNCSPCFLPILNDTVDTSLAKPGKEVSCETCLQPDNEHLMLLCDGCDRGFHTYCLPEPLDAVPIEPVWLCHDCINAGVSPTTLQVKRLQQPAARRGRPPKGPSVDGLGKPALEEASRQALHGRVVERRRMEASGVRQPMRATVHYLGFDKMPYPFDVTYADGSSDRLSLRQVRHSLLPENAVVPAPVSVPSARGGRITRATGLHSSAQLYDELPRVFDLSSTTGVRVALDELMPGPWSVEHVAKLSQFCPGGDRYRPAPARPSQSTSPEGVQTFPEEVTALLIAVDFSFTTSIVDMFSGSGTIRKVFHESGVDAAVTTNDIERTVEAAYHLNALQPASYRALRASVGLQAVVMRPFYPVLDLALPLAVHFADQMVCCRVPRHYLSHAPPARMTWLRQLQQAHRLFVLNGLPIGPMGRRCMWLVIFATPQLRKMLVRQEYQSSLMLSFLAV